MASSSEEDPIENSGDENETTYNEAECEDRIRFHMKLAEKENRELKERVDELKNICDMLEEERDKARDRCDELREDYATLLQKVGSADSKAYLTLEDLEFLYSLRKTGDMVKIHALEDKLNKKETTILKLMLDMGELQLKEKAQEERIDEYVEDRKELMKKMMNLQASNAILARDNEEAILGKKNLEKQLKEVIRELNELKGAATSTLSLPSAKRPRL